MPKFSLYEIDEMLLQAIESREAEAEANEGVYADDWDSFIDAIEIERTKKLLDCARYVKSLEAMAEATKAEKQALSKRQSAYEAKAERIKRYIARSLQQSEKITDANTAISWRKAPASVEIIDESILPEEFLKIEKTPIKTEIKAALAKGEVPGAKMSDEKFTLSIK